MLNSFEKCNRDRRGRRRRKSTQTIFICRITHTHCKGGIRLQFGARASERQEIFPLPTDPSSSPSPYALHLVSEDLTVTPNGVNTKRQDESAFPLQARAARE